MHRNFFVRLGCVAQALVALTALACGGDKDPEPCPTLPPCIAGSTYNATTCACVLDDEVPDAAEGGRTVDATETDANETGEAIAYPEGGNDASDASAD